MGQFDRPPTAAGHADYQYGGGPLSRSASEGGEEEHHRRILRPVLDFLVLAAALLPLKLWWNLADEQCWDPSSYKATELTLLRVTRGVWIAWLTHAAGLLDEALRVFLGIRLTMGLGSPTSVDKTYTKMSRRAEIVAEVGGKSLPATFWVQPLVFFPKSRVTRGTFCSGCRCFYL